jgi:hypothetical protein
MRTLFAAELRALPRHWPLWTLLPFAAIAGWGMLPVNADLYRTHINFDPQGADQTLDNYRVDVFAVYTSGLAWAQLLALFLGAYLVLRDPRLSRSEPPALVAKAAAAALAGLLLAMTALAAALPTAHEHLADHEALQILPQHGVAANELSLADGSVLLVVLCGVATVVLAAVAGVGVGGLLGGWRRRWPFVWLLVGVLALDGLNFMFDSQVVEDYPLLPVVGLYYLFSVVAVPWILQWYVLLVGSAPLGVLVTLILTGGVFLLGYRATRRRRARAGELISSQ